MFTLYGYEVGSLSLLMQAWADSKEQPPYTHCADSGAMISEDAVFAYLTDTDRQPLKT